jgi:hypothetical protein
MPLARGLMQMGRINVYPTATTLVSITPPGSADCGDTISFSVTVANTRPPGTPVPTGTVYIMDQTTGSIVASGPLSGGAATINTPLANGSIQAFAFYPGIVNSFGSSQSTPPVLYSVNIIDTTATVTTTPGSYFCYNNAFSISCHVAPNSGSSTPTGTARFILWSDAVTSQLIGTATLNGSGNASINIPATSTTPGNDYYIQVIYEGGGCFGPTSTPEGTGGTVIHSISAAGNATTTVCTISGSSTFCIHNSSTFNASITSAHLPPPNAGSVTWSATQGMTTITLGTDTSVVSGLASVNVPGDTFPTQGTWGVKATYNGDGGLCYASSMSSTISVVPTEFTPSISYFNGTATFFCYAVAQTYYYSVSGSNGGTIGGTFVLKSSIGNTLATTVTSGAASGFIVGFTVPAFTFSTGSQNIFVQFTSNGSGCYKNVNSGNTGVNVKSFLSQFPSSTQLIVSPTTGYSYTTFNFTINVFKGSGTGPLDGSGSLNGTSTLYKHNGGGYTIVNNNIHIYDYGSYGSGSYSSSGFTSDIDRFAGRWNGNLCYNYQDAPDINVSIFPPPPH